PIGGVEVLSQRTNWAGAEEFLHKSLQCVERFNDRELRKILLQASVHLSLPDLMDKLIAPFMMKVGENWQNGSFRIAHEHLATAVVKWFLAHLRSADDSAGFSPAAIVATPAGQLHEIGALMASMTAMSEGWNTVYLGTDLPVQEIALAALEKKARAILLSLIYPVDDPFMADEIQKLSGLLHDKTTIIVGGQAAKAYKNKLSSSRTIVLESLSEFREQLRELRQQIQP
ncbi:cobalamin-dependent protein, partial [candidate division KSB1 bacterium]|nr:cobalamin-dependent protein [candidate division KSB1 bacterium]